MHRHQDTALKFSMLLISAVLHACLIYGWLHHQPLSSAIPASPEMMVNLLENSSEAQSLSNELESAESVSAEPESAETMPAESLSKEPVAEAVTHKVPSLPPRIKKKAQDKTAVAEKTRQVADNLPEPQAQNPASEVIAPAPEPLIIPATHEADYLHNPRPEYPSISRRMGEEGRVLLHVQVSMDGRPLTIEVKQSSGFVRLDEAARKTAQRWRFVPARRGGETFVSWVDVPIQFSLQK